MELNNVALTIEFGELALTNQCPKLSELLSPLSYAYAKNNEWNKSITTIKMVSKDPFGLKPIIEIAYGLNNGSDDALNEWALKGNPTNPNATVEETKILLLKRTKPLLKDN